MMESLTSEMIEEASKIIAEVKERGGMCLMEPAYTVRDRVRKLTSGGVSWELLGHGRTRVIRMHRQILHQLERGTVTMPPSALRQHAYVVPRLYTQAVKKRSIVGMALDAITRDKVGGCVTVAGS